jgi:transketolase
LQKFDFTPEGIATRGEQTVNFWKDVKPIRSTINRAFTQLI